MVHIFLNIFHTADAAVSPSWYQSVWCIYVFNTLNTQIFPNLTTSNPSNSRDLNLRRRYSFFPPITFTRSFKTPILHRKLHNFLSLSFMASSHMSFEPFTTYVRPNTDSWTFVIVFMQLWGVSHSWYSGGRIHAGHCQWYMFASQYSLLTELTNAEHNHATVQQHYHAFTTFLSEGSKMPYWRGSNR